MSGFAQITGDPDGPPTLPPFGLADGITAQATANAILMALYHRDVHDGPGQVLDLAIIEPILTILGPQPIVYDQLGIIHTRTGNRSVNNAPRNTYRTADGRWVAISTSTQSIAERVMALVGHPEVIDEPWFATGAERAKHADELDSYVSEWIGARDVDDVIVAFEEANAAVAPIYDISQIMVDPQYVALESIVTVEDPDLGSVKMQNVMFRMSDTPGEIRWAGRTLGQDNVAIFGGELDISEERIDELREKGVM
jgi:crotonobetainyl-CoA:carnitine CoA-transferase CaiB-like acyl-CoA transferase